MTLQVGLPELAHNFTSMASGITIRIIEPTSDARAAVMDAVQVIEDVAATCTRFDPSSPLMRVNAQPEAWHRVPRLLVDAVSAAHAAHVATSGMFDPRVLSALVDGGYAASRDFTDAPVLGSFAQPADAGRPTAWAPEFEGDRVRFGTAPIDLGGIGKGLAVRWAAEHLAKAGAGVLVDAGGDMMTRGIGPDGGPWLVGIEDPWDFSGQPVAVIDATDMAVATSSVRLRSWTHEGRTRHHLIDPRTGQPGGEGLVSVTVIASDPADAEVWAKALFLHGAERIAEAARAHRLAAVWVTTDGEVDMSIAATSHITWSVPRAQR